MARHSLSLILLFVLLIPFAPAKDKKDILPAYVLDAKTVLVVIDPDAGTSPSNPNENRDAREAVEKALLKWGRFSPAVDVVNADLVISVRRGHGKVASETIGGVPNDRPVYVESSDSTIAFGGHQGTPPPVTSAPSSPRPHPQTEIGSTEDMFVVYRGDTENPLDDPPIWRYSAKDALASPSVPAVAQFQKVLTQTEKELAKQQQKQPKKP
ncbi:MAG TPA: hypothetical protein VMT53_09760 [Terriglobales bacterium]|nr:hypothetical protein [Terriglobales bacterium]